MKGVKFEWLNAFIFSEPIKKEGDGVDALRRFDLIQCGLLLREPEKTVYYINTDSKFQI